MRYIILCFLILVTIVSCSNTDKHTSQGNLEKQITRDDLKGNWYLNKWTSYHTLIIGDSTIFVDNNVDTVFSIHYTLINDTLKTWTNEPVRIFKNKILSLTKETLTLDGIADIEESRTYSRTKTEFK